MSRFNTRTARPSATSPVATTGRTTVNHQGGTGHLRDAKSELFLLAVSNMVGTDTFYESAGHRDDRYTALIRQLAVEDPRWTAELLNWLRGEGNLRTAAIVGAAEFVKARLDAGDKGTGTGEPGAPSNRAVIASVLQRADEPGELLAYWTSTHGRAVPKPVKRGIADAVQRLYHGKSLLKYDTDSKGYRFGDVLNLVHATPDVEKPWQGELFRYALDRRHNPDTAVVPPSDRTLTANQLLRELPLQERRELLNRPDAAERLTAGAFTWEMLAGWLQSPMDRQAWEAIIPSMGYMALLRNLRNFDQAGVGDEVAERVAAKLADPEQVARSRQLPMRFYSAFNAAPSLRWSWALEKALTASLANIPRLDGRTLVLVDTSGSMESGFSKDGTLMRWDAAALFGIALGHRCEQADVVSFSAAGTWSGRSYDLVKPFPLTAGGSVLAEVRRWKDGGWFIGGGTDTAAALQATFRGHDRVVIMTDEQAAAGTVDQAVPASVPMYTWNLAGYRTGHAPSGVHNRHTFGGLTDAAFRMVPLLEGGVDGAWPWEQRG
ncbi:TROVE domain-containing protein [Kitasatospora sp. RB6PN24]|uniref:TROVE domain-containing protein n=1 Tax=Kitasatospora humi TaxID=2893891 RepID=UPI001E447344|nr:TROVE domain-containing protein [Kitasatospora humi]MCC9308416.1 TROVE domain-containing protein [Kitasatospora humi]